MAKNWKVGEAVRAIQSGNKEDILDIGRRFPLFANLAAQVNEAGVAMLDCVPDYCTARKIESVLKGDVQEAEDDGAADAEEEAPAKKAPVKAAKKTQAKKEAAKKDDDNLESKSAKELFDMCKEAGLNVKPKQDKTVYIEALNAANEEAEDEDDWEDEDDAEEEAPAKKSPAKKAPAKKAPAKKAEADDDDDDDWEV